jgi:hypothetical protein
MSHDKIKAAARQRMAATGEPYAVGRREVIRQHAIGSAEHAGVPSSAGLHSIVSPLVKRRRMRAVTAIAAGALLVAGAAALHGLTGAPVTSLPTQQHVGSGAPTTLHVAIESRKNSAPIVAVLAGAVQSATSRDGSAGLLGGATAAPKGSDEILVVVPALDAHNQARLVFLRRSGNS